MDQRATQAQREQAAQQWRHAATANGVARSQVEDFARQLLNGRQDHRVLEHMSGDAMQSSPAPTSGFLFDTSFGPLQMSVPAMPAFSPTCPTLPFQEPLETPEPSRAVPISMSPPVPGMPLRVDQEFTFPEGAGRIQHVEYSGQRGNAIFNYSSSSTSANFNFSQGAPDAASTLGLPWMQTYDEPAQLQLALQQTQDIVEESSTTPEACLPREQLTTQSRQQAPGHVSAPHADPMNPSRDTRRRRPSVSQAVPGITPRRGTMDEPQNPRLHQAFADQLNEETYFSHPPGAPDWSTAAGAAEKQRAEDDV